MTVDKLSILLVAREQELSAIYQNVPGIIFYVAVEADEFRFLSISDAWLDATGLTREQVVGSLVRDIIPSPSREMVLNYYRQAIRTGQAVRWEETSVYPKGRRYGEVAVMPLFDTNGVATHLIGIVHDITERKQAELDLQDRQRQQDRTIGLLLETAAQGILSVDAAGLIVMANATTERMFGWAPVSSSASPSNNWYHPHFGTGIERTVLHTLIRRSLD